MTRTYRDVCDVPAIKLRKVGRYVNPDDNAEIVDGEKSGLIEQGGGRTDIKPIDQQAPLSGHTILLFSGLARCGNRLDVPIMSYLSTRIAPHDSKSVLGRHCHLECTVAATSHRYADQSTQ